MICLPRRLHFLLAVVFIGSVRPTFADGPAERQEAPSADAQAKAEKVIKNLFKDGYAKKKPAELLSFSGKLREEAKELKDDAVVRFVLFREARDLAIQAGSISQALAIVDDMARIYRVGRLEL